MPKKTTDTVASTPWPKWPVVADGGMLMLSMARFQTDMLQAMLRGQIEALTYTNNRSHQHLKLWKDLLTADYARDGFDIYCSFWRHALEDYSDEAERFTRMGAHLATQAAKRVREEQEELIEEVATQMVM